MKFFYRVYLFSSTNMTLRSSILKEPYSEGDARPERRLTAKAFFLRPTETRMGWPFTLTKNGPSWPMVKRPNLDESYLQLHCY